MRGCDVVAVRGKEPPVIVELKRAFGFGLVLQGVDRLALSDAVYLAVGAWPKNMRNVKKLCRRLGFGLMVVVKERADVVLDPAPYATAAQEQAQGGPAAGRARPPCRRSQSRRFEHQGADDDRLSAGGAALRCITGDQRADEGGGAAR